MEPTQWLNRAEQRLSSEALRTGLAMSGLDLDALWLRCIALAAIPDTTWLTGILDGSHPRTAREHDVIAQALNDIFVDAQQDRPVRYTAQLTTGPPTT